MAESCCLTPWVISSAMISFAPAAMPWSAAAAMTAGADF
jgi:hypothetical protein